MLAACGHYFSSYATNPCRYVVRRSRHHLRLSVVRRFPEMRKLLLACFVGSLSVSASFAQLATFLDPGAGANSRNWRASYTAAYYEPGNPGYGVNPYSGYTGELIKVQDGVTVSLWSSYGAANVKIGNVNASGSFSVPAGQTYVFRVYVRPLDGIWSYSDTAITGVTAPPAGSEVKIRVAYRNTSDYAKELMLMRNGVAVGQPFIVAAGQSFIQTLEHLEPGEYSIVEQVRGFVKASDEAGGTWSVSQNAVTVVRTTPVPAEAVTPQSGGSGPMVNIVPADAPNIPTSAATGGGVWRVAGGNVTTDGLTNSVFREGVDKITANQAKQLAAAAATEAREAANQAESDANKAAWAAVTAESAKSKAVSERDTAYTALGGAIGGPTIEKAAPSHGSGDWVLPILGQDYDLYPGNLPIIGPLAPTIRLLLLGFTLVGYWIWLSNAIRGHMATITLAPQARGNTFAGTGGQVTAGFAAACVTFLTMAAPAAMIAMQDPSLGWNSGAMNLLAPLSATSAGNVGRMAMDLLDLFVPVNTILACASSVLFFTIGGTALTSAVGIGIRWVVPAVALMAALSNGSSEARADITYTNASSSVVATAKAQREIPAHGTFTENNPSPGLDAFLLPEPGGVFREIPFEVLDDGFVYLHPDYSVSVHHPGAVWWFYFAKGFAFGLVAQLVGLSVRLLGRVAGGSETL
ncbi:membrane hypothetical protein [Gammaproteobacteria bacterium]